MVFIIFITLCYEFFSIYILLMNLLFIYCMYANFRNRKLANDLLNGNKKQINEDIFEICRRNNDFL